MKTSTILFTAVCVLAFFTIAECDETKQDCNFKRQETNCCDLDPVPDDCPTECCDDSGSDGDDSGSGATITMATFIYTVPAIVVAVAR